MKEGSYLTIEPGMKVVDALGDEVGPVKEVIVDEASDIFVGLSVSDKGLLDTRRWFVPGEAVERVHDGVVRIGVAKDALEEYHPPSQAGSH